MSIASTIEERLTEKLDPLKIEVINESPNHSGSNHVESHLKLIIVSNAFEGKNLVARHRLIYGELGDLLERDLHALALHTYTGNEWSEQGNAPKSPPCAGA